MLVLDCSYVQPSELHGRFEMLQAQLVHPSGTDQVDAVLAERKRCIDIALRRVYGKYLGQHTGIAADAIEYALQGGGKRIRGLLVWAAYDAAGGKDDITTLAAAVEIIHCYSLVHDDLPCMDDDDMRRGRPTVHRLFGVRAASLAGIAMVPLAARAVLEAGLSIGMSRDSAATMVRELMRAAGGGGMIGGQLLDLEAEEKQIGLRELEHIHRLKTGALIASSLVVGGIAAGGSPRELSALKTFGESIGLAFQIVDDVLDVNATSAELGKTVGKDAAHSKSTYAMLLGVDAALDRAEHLVDYGCHALADASLLTPLLSRIAGYIVTRRS